MSTATRPAGDLLREWRQRRRLSQLELAGEAEISTRHLSFVETGRSHPSREMVLHLSERLEIPLRERNVLLVAAGYAPVYSERRLEDPALEAVRNAIDVVLQGHEPYPALVIDRHWNLVASNRSVGPLLIGIGVELLQPPVNVLRLSLHPEGLASRIVNLEEWRAHLLERLRRQVEVSGDPVILDLLAELRDYSPAKTATPVRSRSERDYAGIVVPLELRMGDAVLAFFSTTTVFGTPLDITLSELALETFFPADSATTEILRNFHS